MVGSTSGFYKFSQALEQAVTSGNADLSNPTVVDLLEQFSADPGLAYYNECAATEALMKLVHAKAFSMTFFWELACTMFEVADVDPTLFVLANVPDLIIVAS